VLIIYLVQTMYTHVVCCSVEYRNVGIYRAELWENCALGMFGESLILTPAVSIL